MQRSTAIARDQDERARSRTMVKARQGEVVRSRTMSMYKAPGETPVREVISIKAIPQKTTCSPDKRFAPTGPAPALLQAFHGWSRAVW